jgi:hypothetical protein
MNAATSACIRSAIVVVWPRKTGTPLGAGIKEPGVECVKALRDGQRLHEVAPDITDQPLHLALIVPS